jgi:hypothetical protein
VLCRKCGNEVPDGWKACNVCGSLILLPAGMIAAKREEKPTSNQEALPFSRVGATKNNAEVWSETSESEYNGPLTRLYKRRNIIFGVTAMLIIILVLSQLL